MWVDVIVEDILRTRTDDAHIVNDAKSPSGPIHVGSLRGVILHDCVSRGLQQKGQRVRFLYGFDDYDPLDALPAGASEEWRRYLGVPLSEVPGQGGAAASFGRQIGDAFVVVFTRLGAHPDIYWTSEMYKSGRFNDAIRVALDWNEVSYECRPDKVEWAQGCGNRGKRSPFDGGSKLQYVVEWAAKWKILGVTVEGAGKDHMTKGGSHDRASAMVRRVFAYPAPYPIPYEFILVGGRKMSTSRGVGMLASALVEILRPELARFLLVRPHYRQQINFDPGGETIPQLYDEYDRAAAAHFGDLQAKTAAEADLLQDHARTFAYASVERDPVRCFRMRFAKVAYLMQMSTVDVYREAEREKGAPLTEADRAELRQRMEDARRWLQTYAPESYRFQVQPHLPSVPLDDSQRAFLGHLAELIRSRPAWSGEELHEAIHTLKTQLGIASAAAFSAIYLAFLGKASGPQAGWFLAALDRAFVVARLREAAQGVRRSGVH